MSAARASSRPCSRFWRAPRRTSRPRGAASTRSRSMSSLDTTNILFICGGAFEGIEESIERRINQKSMGIRAAPRASLSGRTPGPGISAGTRHARRPAQVRPDPGVHRAPARRRHPATLWTIRRPGADSDSSRRTPWSSSTQVLRVRWRGLQFTNEALHAIARGGNQALHRSARPAHDHRRGDARHHVRGPLCRATSSESSSPTHTVREQTTPTPPLPARLLRLRAAEAARLKVVTWRRRHRAA